MNTSGETPAENETLADRVLSEEFLNRLCNPREVRKALEEVGVKDPTGEIAEAVQQSCEEGTLRDMISVWLSTDKGITGFP
ncbi:MAG: hypothetical protein AMJ93_06910 [Anaerolineae bacterium SM23_84]|nr:MAG: hypothetical protein AMJ93_06910 [Anaerolineae bacterium SM23_84]